MTDTPKYTHSFVFESGCLNVKTQGHQDYFSGTLAFDDDDMDYEISDETGKTIRVIKVCREELREMRDFLVRVLSEGIPADEREQAFAEGYEKGVADARGGKWV